MKGKSLIDNDPLVSAVFEAVKQQDAEPGEKLKAVIRAGKIAEAFSCGGTAFESVVTTFSKLAPSEAGLVSASSA